MPTGTSAPRIAADQALSTVAWCLCGSTPAKAGQLDGSYRDSWFRGVRNSGPTDPFPGERRQIRGQEAAGCGRTISDSGSYFPLPRSGSPYAQVPIFPLTQQDVMTLAKPKKGLQKVARERNEPTESSESHFFCERNEVQVRETTNASAV